MRSQGWLSGALQRNRVPETADIAVGEGSGNIQVVLYIWYREAPTELPQLMQNACV